MNIDGMLTPYKLERPVLTASGVPDAFDMKAVDCPLPFWHNGSFRMTFIGFDGIGYQTGMAKSNDLLHWEKMGAMLVRGCHKDWDKVGMACTTMLMENDLYGVRKLKKYHGKYWMMYHSYPGEGYESGSAEIGLAWTDDEELMRWEFADEPVFSWRDGDAFERGGLYKSWLIEHEGKFYMFYNAKNNAEGRWLEQTGMAVSDDMFHWKRCRDINPILPVGKGAWDSTFASDPVVMYDSREKRWVMFYYGLGNLSACDGVAVSDDLYHWEKYPLPILTIGGRGTIDSTYAHKPGVIFHNGMLYHFYCACRPYKDGDPANNDGEFRCISVARSRPWTEDEKNEMEC